MRGAVRAVLAVAVLATGITGVSLAPSLAASPRPEHFATSGDVVDWIYERLLGREPDAAGVRGWTPIVEAPGGPIAVLDGIAQSIEYDNWVGQVIRAYRAAYGRAPDLAGLRGWVNERTIRPGGSFGSRSLAAFLSGPEYDAKLGGTSDAEFVRRVYVNALGRNPDPTGHAAWTRVAATAGRPQVLLGISESAEHRARRRIEVAILGTYTFLLGRFPDPGGTASWTDYLGSGGTLAGLLAGIWHSAELANKLATVPTVTVETLVEGLSIPWGIAFTPDGTMLFTQRGGGPQALQARLPDGTVQPVAVNLFDLHVFDEGGFLDIAVDPAFATNRRFYTCMNRRKPNGAVLDVAVIRWRMDDGGYVSAQRDADLVTGMPITVGRHNGCRILPDPAAPGVLYIATGDAITGTVPQDLTSLGGKLLRVSSETGLAVPGNPFLGSPNENTRRVHGYGHRNIQGLAHRPGTSQIWTAEHGPGRDDELNLVVAGGNYGWNPVPGYNEQVPMTDLAAFPNAIRAAWSSGSRTVATSGMTFLSGCHWGAWNDHAVVALLKGSELRIHGFTTSTISLGFAVPAETDGTFGRLRTVVQGPDGSLYVSTSNGGGLDRIFRLVPSGGRCAAS